MQVNRLSGVPSDTAQIQLHSQNCVFTAVACITLDSKCSGFIIPWLIKMTPLSVPKFYNGLVQVMYHVLHPCVYASVTEFLPDVSELQTHSN